MPFFIPESLSQSQSSPNRKYEREGAVGSSVESKEEHEGNGVGEKIRAASLVGPEGGKDHRAVGGGQAERRKIRLKKKKKEE